MPAYFFDSSALAKFYHAETGTAIVDRIVQAEGNQIRISRLTVVEMLSVFAIKVRSRAIDRQDAGLLLRQLKEDIVSRRFEVVEIREEQFENAERLLEKHAFTARLRALDAWQMAVAVALKDSGRADHFVGSDMVLNEVAAMEGFAVVNPEHA